MSVPSEPMEAEYAIPSISAVANFFCFSQPPTVSAVSASTEVPIGSITTAVAVLDTHMDKKPVASMNPKIRRLGEVPMIFTTYSARRRCRFQRCRASAIRKPPMNKKMVADAYGAPTSLIVPTPASGKMISGSSAVAASGMASVIHHTPIKMVTAATVRMALSVYSASGSAPAEPCTVSIAFEGKIKKTSTAKPKPMKRPMN